MKTIEELRSDRRILRDVLAFVNAEYQKHCKKERQMNVRGLSIWFRKERLEKRIYENMEREEKLKEKKRSRRLAA